jgi:membrane associated rhomboid family serine protease
MSVVTVLLLINGVVFLAELQDAGPLVQWFALWPFGLLAPAETQSGVYPFWPWQLITYGFLHGGLLHILLNMYALWLFGTRLESLWGGRRFIVYYLTCVLGAALTQLVVSEIALLQGGMAYPVLGASGGVFGVLLAFGLRFPETRLLLLFPPIPIKAKWFVLGYGAIELFAGVTGTAEGVAHFAHLGGMLTGWLLLSYRGGRWGGGRRRW